MAVDACRFHAKVLEELGRSRINAVEIGVALTQRMRMLQVSILGILETAINDICKDNGVCILLLLLCGGWVAN